MFSNGLNNKKLYLCEWRDRESEEGSKDAYNYIIKNEGWGWRMNPTEWWKPLSVPISI